MMLSFSVVLYSYDFGFMSQQSLTLVKVVNRQISECLNNFLKLTAATCSTQQSSKDEVLCEDQLVLIGKFHYWNHSQILGTSHRSLETVFMISGEMLWEQVAINDCKVVGIDLIDWSELTPVLRSGK